VVYDKTTGEMLAEMELPATQQGAMTYMAAANSFIVFSGRRRGSSWRN